MEKEYVQAIIIKDNRILMAYGHKENKEPINFFVRGKINEGESANNALQRLITKQINIPYKVIFKLNKEFCGHTETYLINIESENDKFDFSPIEIQKSVGELDVEVLQWVSLSEKEQFNRTNINCLRLLLEECNEQGYTDNWLKAVESLVISHPNYKHYNIELLKNKRINEIKNIDSQIDINEKLYTIGITLILAIIYEKFFSGKQVGISVPIFYIMFMGFFLWSVREMLRFKKNTGFIMIIPTLLISLNYSIHSNSVLNFINGVMIIALTLVSTILIRYENIKWDSPNLINTVLEKVIKAIPQNIYLPLIFIKSRLTSKDKKEMSSTKKSIIRGLIISIPLIIVVLLLLTSADMVFKNYITNFSRGFQFISIGKVINRLLVIIVVFVVVFSYIWSFKYNCDASGEKKAVTSWEPATILTIIFMINIIYLLFSIVQFSYLYGGGSNVLPSQFTYSEYARKGFFELVAVTIINFGILLSSMNFIKKGNKAVNITSNIFLTILVAFTLNMLFSAHYKMSLYEQIYGFTYLRIFVHLFMLMLFILLMVLVICIWYRRMQLNKALVVIILGMYVLLNFINVDKVIAEKNIDIYFKTQKIDVKYLRNLSYDATSEILRLKDDSNSDISREIKYYLADLKRELSYDYSWYEFNYSKYRAKKIIEEN